MRASYLGIELSSPVVVASSPYTASRANIERCVRHGAGAVVLKSIFEEQIFRHATALERNAPPMGMGDSGEYLERYLDDAYRAEYLRLVSEARATDIPVIASINCLSGSDRWVEYAVDIQGAGASALELNLFLLATDRHHTAEELEIIYGNTVAAVVSAVTIPVSVKLPMRLTNFLSLADRLLGAGARGVVLFNRFFEPDIDIERLCFVPSDPFSTPSELRNVLRPTALCSTALPQLDIAVSTGVHDGAAAIKALLCGASVVQLCTAIHRMGYRVIENIHDFIEGWADRHGFDSLAVFRGCMNFGNIGDDNYQRIQYMKYFPHGAE